MDFFPFPGLLGGSFFWEKSTWSLAIYSEDKFISDDGDSLFLPGNKSEGIPLSFVLAPLWNGLWPTIKDSIEFEGMGLLKIMTPRETRYCHIDSKQGVIDKVWSADKQLELTLSDYTQMQKQLMPSKIVLYKRGLAIFEMVVNEVQFNPNWTNSPFYIRPPNQAKRMHP